MHLVWHFPSRVPFVLKFSSGAVTYKAVIFFVTGHLCQRCDGHQITLFPDFLGRTKKAQDTQVWGDTACNFGLGVGPVLSPPYRPKAAPRHMSVCRLHGGVSPSLVLPHLLFPYLSRLAPDVSQQLMRLPLTEAARPASILPSLLMRQLLLSPESSKVFCLSSGLTVTY